MSAFMIYVELSAANIQSDDKKDQAIIDWMKRCAGYATTTCAPPTGSRPGRTGQRENCIMIVTVTQRVFMRQKASATADGEKRGQTHQLLGRGLSS